VNAAQREVAVKRIHAAIAWPFLVGWSIYFLALELLGHFRRLPAGHAWDFYSFYVAGKGVRSSPAHLYDPSALPFFHLPYEALLYAPFSMASYHPAYLLFIGFNLVLLLGVFFIGPFSDVIPIWQPRPGLMLFAFLPVFVAVIQGQISILLLLICCLAWRQWEHPTRCGLILSLALFKFNIILPLACLLALRKGRRFAIGFLAGCTAVLLACFAMVGRYGTASFVGLIRSGSLAGNNAVTAQNMFQVHPAMMPNLMGLLYGLGARHLPASGELLLTAASSVLVFAWCAYRVRSEKEEATAFALATVCALLVSYHLYLHDLSLLLIAMALLRPSYRIVSLLFLAPVILLLFAPHYLFLAAVPVLLLLGRKFRTTAKPVSRPPIKERQNSSPAIPAMR
jgi:hypothetical protein